MAVSESLIEHVREMLAEMGPIGVRKMFGGAGVFRDELMFGLIAGEDLYLKTDDANRAEFEAAGSGPFVFDTRDGVKATSYWRVPSTAADDPAEALRWARLGLDAALRAKRPKKAKKKLAADLGPGPWTES